MRLTPDGVGVRVAGASDLEAVRRITNAYIADSAINFEVEPRSREAIQTWASEFHPESAHILLAAEVGGTVVGYCCSHSFRSKAAYATSVETSVYVDPEYSRRGIGRALYRELFDRLAERDLHRAYAGITLPNDASLALHSSFGFRDAGLFREVGRKFGRYWDVQWLEKALS